MKPEVLTFLERLHAFREKALISDVQASKLLGMNPNTLTRWELARVGGTHHNLQAATPTAINIAEVSRRLDAFDAYDAQHNFFKAVMFEKRVDRFKAMQAVLVSARG